jgi:hypothetical protein
MKWLLIIILSSSQGEFDPHLYGPMDSMVQCLNGITGFLMTEVIPPDKYIRAIGCEQLPESKLKELKIKKL